MPPRRADFTFFSPVGFLSVAEKNEEISAIRWGEQSKKAPSSKANYNSNAGLTQVTRKKMEAAATEEADLN